MILLCSSCNSLAVKLISGTHYFVYLFTQKCISGHVFYQATTIISCLFLFTKLMCMYFCWATAIIKLANLQLIQAVILISWYECFRLYGSSCLTSENEKNLEYIVVTSISIMCTVVEVLEWYQMGFWNLLNFSSVRCLWQHDLALYICTKGPQCG
jgi:hypothetical protein